MKLRNPINRDDLHLKRNWRVLEVGGGHNPHSRSNVVVDKYVDSNYHRSGDLKVYKNSIMCWQCITNLSGLCITYINGRSYICTAKGFG